MKISFAATVAISVCVAPPVYGAGKDEHSADKEQMVCRSYELVGSRLPHRICHSKAEWKQIDAAAEGVRGENRRQIERNQNQIQHTDRG